MSPSRGTTFHKAASTATWALALALAACGGGGGSNGFTPIGGFGGTANIVTGVVSAGPVAGAQVCAFSLNAGAVVAPVGTCATTDSAGNYTINLGTYNGPLLVQATHGSYVDEASGNAMALDVASPNDAGLRSMLANPTGGTVSVAITALTEVAYQMADSTNAGLTPTNIAAAVSSVETNFGVGDIIGTMPVDPLNLPASATAAQKSYALALAAMSEFGAMQSKTLADTAALLQACLSSPTTACGSGAGNIGTELSAAVSAFLAGHPALTGYAGVTLPVANFGNVTASGGGGGTGATGVPLSLLAGIVTGSGSQDGPAATALFGFPLAGTLDGSGNLYVVDGNNNIIRKITPAGIVSTLAGTAGVVGSNDATGPLASFNNPTGIAFDGASGNLYVSDTGNNTIRQITLPAGTVSTFAGTPGQSNGSGGSYDGPYAIFSHPTAVATDGSGLIYVVDPVSGYTNLRILTPTPGGPTPSSTTTIGGANGSNPYCTGRCRTNYVNGSGTSASFSQFYQASQSIAYDRSTGNPSSGNILIADTYNGAIRMMTPAGVVSTYAGSCPPPVPAAGGTTTSQSCAGVIAANFNDPTSVAVDAAGNLFVVDSAGLQQITPAGVVTTITNTLTSYQLQFLLANASGTLYTAMGSTISAISAAGAVTTVAGVNATGSTDGFGGAARFNSPNGIASDLAGNLYVTDTGNGTVRSVTASGVVSTLAGTVGTTMANLPCYGDGVTAGCGDGAGASARFNNPDGVAFDSASGDVFVTDQYGGTIRRLTPTGVVTTYAGLSGIATDTLACYGTTTTCGDGTGPGATFTSPSALATDSAGNLYVADNVDCVIRKIAPGAVVTTLAGTPGTCGSSDAPAGPGSAASFNSPQGIAADSAGNVYVADTGNNTIRKITPAGSVTTLAGTAATVGSQDGSGANASFSGPQGLIVDASGNIYVADTNNQTIRKITAAGVVTTIAIQAGSAAGLPVPLSRPTSLALFGTTLYAVSGNAIVYVANVP